MPDQPQCAQLNQDCSELLVINPYLGLIYIMHRDGFPLLRRFRDNHIANIIYIRVKEELLDTLAQRGFIRLLEKQGRDCSEQCVPRCSCPSPTSLRSRET